MTTRLFGLSFVAEQRSLMSLNIHEIVQFIQFALDAVDDGTHFNNAVTRMGHSRIVGPNEWAADKGDGRVHLRGIRPVPLCRAAPGRAAGVTQPPRTAKKNFEGD
ncbi:hypothetical protein EVAR_22922_1 [Eumeta japonica]|uniref:Uncharacterized protein n=1 Tax=Eumeta variegata TaxID=151549 RepID=A0A4C1UUW2_EUMVA|nr:hypothetical protein EVAR_22922_1 [Eumeta japonica]